MGTLASLNCPTTVLLNEAKQDREYCSQSATPNAAQRSVGPKPLVERPAPWASPALNAADELPHCNKVEEVELPREDEAKSRANKIA
jgi:hypothetical protein